MIALDIDGTLTGEAWADVPEPTARAVTAARVAGNHIVLATGRSLDAVLPIVRSLNLTTGWIVASNGAVVARLAPDAPGGYVVEVAHELDIEPVVRCVLDLIPDARIGVEDIGWGHVVNHRFDGLLGKQALVRSEELWARSGPHVIITAADLVDRALEPLRALGVTANPHRRHWIDVTPAALSKASALELVRLDLGIALEHTVAVGDGVNDIEMLRWAGRGVAMGHAPAVVREAADEITGTLADNGVISVLSSLLSTPTTMEATP